MSILGTMDPNSKNQRWSKWKFDVIPGGTRLPAFAQIKHAAAIFARVQFGSASECRVTMTRHAILPRNVLTVEVRSEGHPVHDPMFCEWMHGQWTRWALRGFGSGTTCSMVEAKLEAGDRQNGKPRDQLIIMDSTLLPSLKG